MSFGLRETLLQKFRVLANANCPVYRRRVSRYGELHGDVSVALAPIPVDVLPLLAGKPRQCFVTALESRKLATGVVFEALPQDF